MDKTIQFHVIGDGEYLDSVKALAKANVNIVVAGRRSGAELNNYLLHRCRLGFAMGTSALEFAALGIPVVAVDPSKKIVDCGKMRLRWLHEVEHYDLGNFVGEAEVAPVDFERLRDVLFSRESNFHAGGLAFRYVSEGHDLEVIIRRLNSHLLDTSLTISDLDRTLGDSPLPLGPAVHRLFKRFRLKIIR